MTDDASTATPTLDREPSGWTPEFPGQRPPFTEGNTAALRTGAHSPRVYGPRAQELAAGLLADRPDLGAPAYAAAVTVWATFLARFEFESAKPDPSDHWLVRFGNAVLKAGASLGLDPTSDARLTRDRATAAALAQTIDLGALAARGRAALDARDASPTLPADLEPEADTDPDREDDRP
mgnify:CR=1 FL=1|jgi:hypothetical protein